MKNNLNSFLLYILIVSLLSSCSEKAIDKVKISVHCEGAKNIKVQAFTTDMLSMDRILLSESTLDSTGNGVLEFDLANPLFGTVVAGDREAAAYMVAGDEFKVLFDSLQKPHGIKYLGDEAAVNEYLTEYSSVVSSYNKVNGKSYFQLKQDEFLSVKDSLEKDLAKLYRHLKENTTLNPELSDVLNVQNEMICLFFVQNYVGSNYESQADSTTIPEAIRKVINKVPDDSLALKYHMDIYSAVVSGFLDSKINDPVYEELEGMKPDSIAAIFPVKAYDKIDKSGYPYFLKKYLQAKYIYDLLRFDGISPQFNSVYKRFKKSVKNQDYLTAIQKKYNQWLSIEPGKPAPDFYGITPDGKKISLSDFKGKVVYVDVWATWCGPCREELPFSKKIQQAFKDNDQVVFLYVSVDENIENWKEMLKKEKDFKGIHINQHGDKPGTVWEPYLLSGIPRYILIDADGKIVHANAFRPSSGKVTAQIRELLSSNKLVSR
jgi:thiol-disulfide isomerase/thioredoxin